MLKSDLNLLCQWFAKPHIREWWTDALEPDDIKQKYGNRISNPIVCPFIAYLSEKPFAFIQFYWANKIGGACCSDEDNNTIGIDQFIGEEDWLNRCYGTLLIQQFITFLCQKHPKIKKIITEVSPNNLRAKRCYEKVGFRSVGIIDTPQGSVIKLMLLQ